MDKNSENKTNIFYLIIVALFIVVSTIYFGATIYSPFSDIGRELYIPEQINKGLTLYKDLFNVYPPLSYIINSILTKLLGNNISIFLLFGCLSTILTTVPIYLLTKKFTNKHIAFIVSLFICSSCSFYTSISNWILPYSYGITYALCSIMWSFYNLKKYEETNENKFLYYSSILVGLSLCFKLEFIGFLLIFFLIMILKKTNIKIGIKALSFLFVFPLITLAILLIQNCSINDLTTGAKYIINLTQSETVRFFYEYSGISLSKNTITRTFYTILNPNLRTLFYPITYICFIFLIITIVKKDYKIALLLFTGLILSLKSLGGISFEIYGTYFFPLLFIGIITYLYKNPNKYKSTIIYVICLCLFICYTTNNIKKINNLAKIKTEKGTIKIPSIYENSTKDILKYITTKTQTDDRILILAEGTLINYLTGCKSENYLYYLIPPNNDIFGKKFIEKKLLSEDIDIIITTNIQYPWYNEKSFITGWGKEYIKVIETKYQLQETIGNNLQFNIYKRDII